MPEGTHPTLAKIEAELLYQGAGFNASVELGIEGKTNRQGDTANFANLICQWGL